ncbi:MAG TPA: L-fucose:H+ symporter permease [Sedimentisphaerales bacterium]|nr:L-fucose:H+ symporter permease [Sedimentisphaerales bacterium]
MDDSKPRVSVVPAQVFGAFVLVTTLFALWGFANDITNPMVAAFKNILLISHFESSLVQFAFYGGYCVMAIPASLFIKRFSYKAGILTGLLLYALGCLMFIPSGWMMAFWAFLLSYFVMTCGLSFLETSANPYILAMGPEETATRRLNFAQSFNPMGSLMGMFVAMSLILANINPMTETGRRLVQGLAAGQTYHQQMIDAAFADVNEVNDGGGISDASPAALQAGVKAAYDELIRMSPEWTEKAVVATKILDDASMATEDRKDVLKVARKEVAGVFKGQDAFINLKTGEVDKSALDKAILAREEFEQSPAALKAVIEAARSEALAVLGRLQPVATGSSPAAAEIKQTVGEVLPMLTHASGLFQGVESSVMEPVRKAAQERLVTIQQADLNVIIGPYFVLGLVVLTMLVVFAVYRLPRSQGEGNTAINFGPTLKRLLANRKYVEGVVAQAFYVGAQIMMWTFIIQYAENELGMPKTEGQMYNMAAMGIFVTSRFICTALLKYVSPGGLLLTLAIGGFWLVFGTIFIKGMVGLYCLVGVSACMSLMFPTIYGIALKGLGDDAKLGAAGLIMAIGGGCLMPPMQGWIMDKPAFNLGFMTLSSTRASFVLPLICFVVIAIFGLRTWKVHRHTY